MKYLIIILGIFGSTLTLMELLHLLNQGNTVANIVGLIGIFLLGYIIIKTRLFTQFKQKKK